MLQVCLEVETSLLAWSWLEVKLQWSFRWHRLTIKGVCRVDQITEIHPSTTLGDQHRSQSTQQRYHRS